MPEPIKSRAVNALSWSFIQEAALRGLQFGIQIFLARLLMPEQFGLVAMLGVFIGLAQALVDGGFASALIQAKQPTEAQKSSIFYFNIAGSAILSGLLWLAAPCIADFYHQPLLRSMLRWFALMPVINGFGLVQNTLLVRNLQVKKQTLIMALSTLIAGTVAVVLAWRGFGVWSLVCSQLLQSFLRTVMLWFFNDWRPQWMFSVQALREMFKFGWGMLCSVILASVYEQLYPLLIGKFFAAETLGYFNRAQSLQTVSSQSLGAIANRVTFPLFASMQDDLVRFKKGLRRALTTITFLQFPMMIGLAVVAKPLVLIVFSAKWAPSIPYLQLLAFAGLMFPLHILNLNVLVALGRSDLFFRLEVVKVSLFLLSAFLTYRWGVQAMICGQISCDVTSFFLNAFYTKRLIDYSITQQLRDLFPCLFAAIVMGLLDTLVASFLPDANVLQLGFRIAFGATVYFLICRGMSLSALEDFVGLISRKSAAVTPAQQFQG